MITLINMGYDARKSLLESGITGDEWAYYVGTDWINIGSISNLDKLRTEGMLLSTNQHFYKPITFDYAQAYYLKRSPSMTKVYADSAIAFLLKKQTRMADDYRFYASLGKCYALAGNEQLAIQNGKKAIELLPITLDAFQGPDYERNLAEIYIMLNKYDLAMDKIEMLLSIPSNLSVGWMMADPFYEPIRNLPRFKKLAEKYQYVGKG